MKDNIKVLEAVGACSKNGEMKNANLCQHKPEDV